MARYLSHALVVGVLLLTVIDPALGQLAIDPATTDPPADAQHPARLVSFTFTSGGEPVLGRALIAQGQGPHPTVLLLHGMPGLELNLDLAQAVRRAGWNVFMLHYRGSWGSGGDFSFKNVADDTKTAVDVLHASPSSTPAWRVDANRIVLIGHSVGGFAALTVAASHPQVKAVASIAGFDVGGQGVIMASTPEAKDRWLGVFRSTRALKVPDPEKLLVQWAAAAPEIQFVKLDTPLSLKPVLLVAGGKDTVAPPPQHHEPLAKALRAKEADKFAEVVLDADHSFSDKRIALTRAVLDWLDQQK